ncbi:pentatricopeptide repeat-containing protein At4g21300-like [Pistacia vera]|uniref:pentatricopeptide repeat-containing protein At4g21300-like n=1 Tax=Pistacia vera TaxID=55513 RepID=UPI00126383F4|nr:pentatricopeptide repeat-containing protein At4g21300-like [Pistacia vera]
MAGNTTAPNVKLAKAMGKKTASKFKSPVQWHYHVRLQGTWIGREIHCVVLRTGKAWIRNQLSVSTAFLSMYAKFEILIRQLYFGHKIEGFNPDAVSLISVISACSKLEVILLGKSVHAFSLRNGLHSNIDVSNALLMFYSDCDQLSYSFKLFHRMPLRNAVSWNTLISGCIHSGKTEEATILLEQMQKEGAELDMVTLISIIPCFSESENLKQGMAIHGYAVKTGYASDVSLANALITMYCNCGNLSDGRLLFEVMYERNLVSWNSLITGCRYHNLQNEVLVLFREMRREGQRPNHMQLSGLRPNEIIYSSILSACSHAGLVGQSQLVFNSMVGHGISPRMEHYAFIVDLLGRAGYLNEAFDKVKLLPFKPSVSLLKSLLGACRVHGNVELGEKISEMLFEIDPENSGSYVTLHNIYASAGKWEDANRVRSEMEQKRLKKMPGFSLVGDGQFS